LRRVVVETWADWWPAELTTREPPMDEAMEYMDIRLLAAMVREMGRGRQEVGESGSVPSLGVWEGF
jgi:hypothetical protein